MKRTIFEKKELVRKLAALVRQGRRVGLRRVENSWVLFAATTTNASSNPTLKMDVGWINLAPWITVELDKNGNQVSVDKLMNRGVQDILDAVKELNDHKARIKMSADMAGLFE